MQGREYFFRFNRDDNAMARQLAHEGIALDPKFPNPHVLLGPK
jgi:hypothetical protein